MTTPLLNVVNITCDTLESAASELRGLEVAVTHLRADKGWRAGLAAELAGIRRALETVTRALHEERRMTCRR